MVCCEAANYAKAASCFKIAVALDRRDGHHDGIVAFFLLREAHAEAQRKNYDEAWRLYELQKKAATDHLPEMLDGLRLSTDDLSDAGYKDQAKKRVLAAAAVIHNAKLPATDPQYLSVQAYLRKFNLPDKI
jgi:hypothetical protein